MSDAQQKFQALEQTFDREMKKREEKKTNDDHWLLTSGRSLFLANWVQMFLTESKYETSDLVDFHFFPTAMGEVARIPGKPNATPRPDRPFSFFQTPSPSPKHGEARSSRPSSHEQSPACLRAGSHDSPAFSESDLQQQATSLIGRLTLNDPAPQSRSRRRKSKRKTKTPTVSASPHQPCVTADDPPSLPWPSPSSASEMAGFHPTPRQIKETRRLLSEQKPISRTRLTQLLSEVLQLTAQLHRQSDSSDPRLRPLKELVVFPHIFNHLELCNLSHDHIFQALVSISQRIEGALLPVLLQDLMHAYSGYPDAVNHLTLLSWLEGNGAFYLCDSFRHWVLHDIRYSQIYRVVRLEDPSSIMWDMIDGKSVYYTCPAYPDTLIQTYVYPAARRLDIYDRLHQCMENVLIKFQQMVGLQPRPET